MNRSLAIGSSLKPYESAYIAGRHDLLVRVPGEVSPNKLLWPI